MTKSIAISLMVVVAGFLISVVLENPGWLSDANSFLKDFVGSNLLNVLGVILAITLASAAQLHLEFNKAEERHGRRGLNRSREGVRGATYSLIVLFTISVVVLVYKPVLGTTERWQAAINSIELYILFMNVMLLVDLTQTAFTIQPAIEDRH